MSVRARVRERMTGQKSLISHTAVRSDEEAVTVHLVAEQMLGQSCVSFILVVASTLIFLLLCGTSLTVVLISEFTFGWP